MQMTTSTGASLTHTGRGRDMCSKLVVLYEYKKQTVCLCRLMVRYGHLFASPESCIQHQNEEARVQEGMGRKDNERNTQYLIKYN